ncbi:MAG: 4Fe-4S binding protein, partial [Candidatus Riflebacteria bacterium]|nr:4Fe-4S binding protein [Candidatus Riflebacteria bacterium]
PIALKTSNECNDCKACAKICPENAIPIENPRITDATKCNNCTACIYVCPQGARKFSGLGYTIISAIFRRMCTKRLEPEFFYI